MSQYYALYKLRQKNCLRSHRHRHLSQYHRQTIESDKMVKNNKTFEWDLFITEGAEIDGNSTPFCLPQEIPWFDKSAFERGRKFFWDNIFLLMCGFFSNGFVNATTRKSGATALFRKYHYYPENHLFERSITTAKYFLIWASSSLENPKGEGAKMMRKVRKMHEGLHLPPADEEISLLPIPGLHVPVQYHYMAENVKNAMQHVSTEATLETVTHLRIWNPEVPFSQLHMELTQFEMFDFLWTWPLLANIMDQQEISCYTHWWAVVGRMLGVEDRFNLALHQDPGLYRRVLENFVICSLKEVDATGMLFLYGGARYPKLQGMLASSAISLLIDQTGGSVALLFMNPFHKFLFGTLKFTIYLYLRIAPVRYLLNCITYYVLRFMIYFCTGYDYKKNNKKHPCFIQGYHSE